MNVHKFCYFTIQGDNLDLAEAQNLISLPCRIFRKGEIISKKINEKFLTHSQQKTNRWLYCAEDVSEVSSEDFLLNQLEILIDHLAELQNYITKGMAKLELNLYAENATDFNFCIEHISKLSLLGLGIAISFC